MYIYILLLIIIFGAFSAFSAYVKEPFELSDLDLEDLDLEDVIPSSIPEPPYHSNLRW